MEAGRVNKKAKDFPGIPRFPPEGEGNEEVKGGKGMRRLLSMGGFLAVFARGGRKIFFVPLL
jgi:hypothetical protein